MVYFACPLCHFELKLSELSFTYFGGSSVHFHQCINPQCANYRHIFIEEAEKKLQSEFRLQVLMKDRKPLENPVISETPPPSCAIFEVKPKRKRSTTPKQHVGYDHVGSGNRRRHTRT